MFSSLIRFDMIQSWFLIIRCPFIVWRTSDVKLGLKENLNIFILFYFHPGINLLVNCTFRKNKNDYQLHFAPVLAIVSVQLRLKLTIQCLMVTLERHTYLNKLVLI